MTFHPLSSGENGLFFTKEKRFRLIAEEKGENNEQHENTYYIFHYYRQCF